MNSKLTQSRRVLRLPIAILVLGASLWIAGAVLQITSPTSSDPTHMVPFHNHGTVHYLSWPVRWLPWVGFGLGVVGIALIGCFAGVLRPGLASRRMS